MKLAGVGFQSQLDDIFDASGTITTGGTAQLLLGRSVSRSYLFIQPTGAASIRIKFGSARAHATISGGVVTAVTVDDPGFGFSYAPTIEFLGGGGKDGFLGNSSYVGLGQPGAMAPSAPAIAHCVMSGSAPNMTIASVVVDYGGANYLAAPYVSILNSQNDPNGCATPSDTSGILIGAGAVPFLEFNGTVCPTVPIGVFSDTTGAGFTALWMP